MTRALVLFAVLSIALSSCSNSSGGGAIQTSDPLIPMIIGNYWVMDTTFFDASGSSHAGGEDSIKVLSSTVSPKDHSTYFNLTYYWLRVSTDGLYYAAPPSFYYAYRFFKYPASPGDIFRDHNDVNFMPFPVPSKPDSVAALYSNYTLKTNSVSVTTPAGTFNCYDYVANWSEGATGKIYQREEFFLAPGIGFVRTDHYSVIAPDNTQLKLRTRVDLKAYKLN
jgi:hypothetical protein